MAKGGFPLSHGCVKFTFSNKIEAMLEWSWMVARKSKSWTSLNFTYKLNTLYPASILFTRVKISCLQTHVKVTRKRKPTLNLSTGITFSEIPSYFAYIYNILLTYMSMAQFSRERRCAEREVMGSNPSRTKSQALQITEKKVLPLLWHLQTVGLSTLFSDKDEKRPLCRGSTVLES